PPRLLGPRLPAGVVGDDPADGVLRPPPDGHPQPLLRPPPPPRDGQPPIDALPPLAGQAGEGRLRALGDHRRVPALALPRRQGARDPGLGPPPPPHPRAPDPGRQEVHRPPPRPRAPLVLRRRPRRHELHP